MPTNTISFLMLIVLLCSCNKPSSVSEANPVMEKDLFPEELTNFRSYEKNPLFSGTGGDTWDQLIRERGYILREDDGYHLWYTGYREGLNESMALGYATSPDGINWTRYGDKPIFSENWVEDMMVVKRDGVYYMFAEGKGDIAHLLTSSDRIHWKDHGSLQIQRASGEPLTPGPYGTPTVFIDKGIWYLFYERNDDGIWVATSADLKIWKNIHDEAVITKGPESYDKFGVAMNQIIQHGDHYYAYYHGTPTADWSVWNTNVAVSKDLLSWTKYPQNPIVEENKSSGILVHDGDKYRLYTMHEKVNLHFPVPTK